MLHVLDVIMGHGSLRLHEPQIQHVLAFPFISVVLWTLRATRINEERRLLLLHLSAKAWPKGR